MVFRSITVMGDVRELQGATDGREGLITGRATDREVASKATAIVMIQRLVKEV